MNLTGAFLCTREAARVMDNGASIVNIASQAAKTGFRQMAPYVSSKHGMIGLTRTAAIDLASKGIRVSAVCPNHMTTTMGKAQSEYFSSLRGWPEAYRAQISEHIPLGRVGRLEDTAAAVAFLASDEAAFMTSEALNVSWRRRDSLSSSWAPRIIESYRALHQALNRLLLCRNRCRKTTCDADNITLQTPRRIPGPRARE